MNSYKGKGGRLKAFRCTFDDRRMFLQIQRRVWEEGIEVNIGNKREEEVIFFLKDHQVVKLNH